MHEGNIINVRSGIRGVEILKCRGGLVVFLNRERKSDVSYLSQMRTC